MRAWLGLLLLLCLQGHATAQVGQTLSVWVPALCLRKGSSQTQHSFDAVYLFVLC